MMRATDLRGGNMVAMVGQTKYTRALGKVGGNAMQGESLIATCLLAGGDFRACISPETPKLESTRGLVSVAWSYLGMVATYSNSLGSLTVQVCSFWFFTLQRHPAKRSTACKIAINNIFVLHQPSSKFTSDEDGYLYVFRLSAKAVTSLKYAKFAYAMHWMVIYPGRLFKAGGAGSSQNELFYWLTKQ